MDEVVSQTGDKLLDITAKVFSSGTFSGNPLTMTAGLATVTELEKDKVYPHVNRLGDMIGKGLAESELQFVCTPRSGFRRMFLPIHVMRIELNHETETRPKRLSSENYVPASQRSSEECVAVSVGRVSKFARERNVRMIDLKFTDLIGRWRHVTLPIRKLDGQLFTEGAAFDGSSVPGFKSVEASDLSILPDPGTIALDPFSHVPTLSMICNVVESDSKKPFSGDPRHIAKKAEGYLVRSGIADQSYWGLELELYVFDSIRYRQDRMFGYYYIKSREGSSDDQDGKEPSLGYNLPPRGGYYAIPPSDTLYDLRMEMMEALEECGVAAISHHHEGGGLGQMEFAVAHEPLMKAADTAMLAKYVIKNVAVRHGKTATFMPKPVNHEATNALHVHQSLVQAGEPIFYDSQGYAQLSKTAMYYIGGVLRHASALLALTASSTNSYKRLLPGYEEPTTLSFSSANRTACIRIPSSGASPRAKRIEYRAQDASCNIYLALAAILMAGLDGIQDKIDPITEGFGPFDVDIDKLSQEERTSIKSLPCSLREALQCLEAEHEFLTRGGVFDEDFIKRWINYKTQMEVVPVETCVHPYEYYLYYDV